MLATWKVVSVTKERNKIRTNYLAIATSEQRSRCALSSQSRLVNDLRVRLGTAIRGHDMYGDPKEVAAVTEKRVKKEKKKKKNEGGGLLVVVSLVAAGLGQEGWLRVAQQRIRGQDAGEEGRAGGQRSTRWATPRDYFDVNEAATPKDGDDSYIMASRSSGNVNTISGGVTDQELYARGRTGTWSRPTRACLACCVCVCALAGGFFTFCGSIPLNIAFSVFVFFFGFFQITGLKINFVLTLLLLTPGGKFIIETFEQRRFPLHNLYFTTK